ncbi:uncharacterized protein F5Z01DRAFT_691813 [Emericellopsis atlantica]|uniref:Uncharacterized protein n=1 Tax=Emericellopsis atlantica TaxID=2614577 RepID=A0A9P8CLL9_9HYPO|nr:uncharacterized protein F5Z01DRAFT_691813 [Emericellopsis atlantica]KAG9251789.1 hypothetical protein F5Z01DRAFT_691813 [Emericellopsis atlantica]
MTKLPQHSHWDQLRLQRAEIFKSLMLKDDTEPVVSGNMIYSITDLTTETLTESFNIVKGAIEASDSGIVVDGALMEALLAEVFDGWGISTCFEPLNHADMNLGEPFLPTDTYQTSVGWYPNGNTDSQASYCVRLNYEPPSLRFYYADTVCGRELTIQEIETIFNHERIGHHEQMELLETVGKDMKEMVEKENKARAIEYIRRMIMHRNNTTIDPRRALPQRPDKYHFMDFELGVMQRYPLLNLVRGPIEATRGVFSSMRTAPEETTGKSRRENSKQKQSVRFHEPPWLEAGASTQQSRHLKTAFPRAPLISGEWPADDDKTPTWANLPGSSRHRSNGWGDASDWTEPDEEAWHSDEASYSDY